MKQQHLHIIFLLGFGLCLFYGSWLYIDHSRSFDFKKAIKSNQATAPAAVSIAYENSLTSTLSTENHWTLKGLASLKSGLLSTSITHKVAIGKEDWLFLQKEGGANEVIQQSLGIYQYTPYELKLWSLLFRQRQAWAKTKDIDYVLVITPNKSSIYPEYLPNRYHDLGNKKSRQQLAAALPNLPLIDLTDSIRQHKKKGLLFLKNDTHWNELGAFFGYQSVMRALPAAYGTKPLKLTDCHISTDTALGEDLARMMLQTAERFELSPSLELRQATAQYVTERSIPHVAGLTPQVYVNPEAPLPKVLFDHDSFFKDLWPFFAEHFSESIFLWSWQGFHTDLISQEKPQLIVDEFVERSLLGTPPRNNWPVIQQYWKQHFEELPLLAKYEGLTFEEVIPALNHLRLPKGSLPIMRIEAQPAQTDKLVIDYGNDQGFYWLRDSGEVYYLEYDSERIMGFRVENGSLCSLRLDVRIY